ncbi:putative secreted protein with PEP-CTERM sorting signal [Pseudoduganella flava]|nr:PEP-CTERM sorting domain-containing protein [Pseudoduganella flava]TWI48281.1 putative secreted protein with PEP-CTERM sorting signal [Pseudoduganella flava]
MLKRLARSLALSLLAALPLSTLAAPVSVTTHTSGTSAYGDWVVVDALGITNYDYRDQPFELTLQSTFDTDVNTNFWWGDKLWIFGADLTVTFRIGDETFHKQGKGQAMLGSGSDSYYQQVSFYDSLGNGKLVDFTNYVMAPQNAAAGDPLAERDASASGERVGSMGMDAYNANPDANGLWMMGDYATNASVTVVSSVPEPSQWAMMAAGLVAATVVARRRQRT